MLDRFLFHDAAERERLLELTLRLRLAFAVAVAVMAIPLGFGISVFGVAAIIPLLIGGAIYAALDLSLPHARRPERRVLASAVVGVVATLTCIWLADGPKQYLFAAPVVPMLGFAAVSARRASVTAALCTSAGILIVGFGSYGAEVRAMPPIVILPILLILVTVLGSMASRSAEDIDRETSVVDPLTGLLNRVALQARATELQLHAAASADRVGMIVADIDHFGRVNTEAGHAAGDAVLVEVARRLRAEVGTAGTVFRFGGEEFVVLLQSASPGTAVEWAKRLREAICFAPIDGFDITGSFGVAVSDPQTGFRYRALFAQADSALYRAKTLGRDRVCSADDPARELVAVEPVGRPVVRRATDVAPAADGSAPAPEDGSWDARLRGTAEGNWLIADGVERAHAVDLLERSAKASKLNSLIILGGLLLCGIWLSWWILIPPVVAGLAWRLCTTRIATVRRPEFAALGGLLGIVLAGAAASLLAQPSSLVTLPLGALAVFGASAGFNRAGAAVIAATAMLATSAAAFAIDTAAVVATPFVLVFPLALIAANAILGQSVGRVARDHRVSVITDGLTGSLNRAALEARIPQLVQHAATSGAPTTLALMDLDALAAVNAAHGRPAGDRILSGVSERLRGTLRSFDSVYRIDGRLFLIVLTDTAAVDAREIAERARRAVGSEPIQGIAVTVSLGVATAPAGEPLDYDGVLGLAYARLAAAKRTGRNRTVDRDDFPVSSLRLVAAA